MSNQAQEITRVPASSGHGSVAAAPRTLLRQCIAEELERVSAELLHAGSESPHASGARRGRVALAALQGRVRWLGQLMAGLAGADALHLDPHAAGFGATAKLEDLATGERLSYTLMSGSSIDVGADQVSLDSPIGHALRGCRDGDVIDVDTPAGTRRLRVLGVTTLMRKFGQTDAEQEADARPR